MPPKQKTHKKSTAAIRIEAEDGSAAIEIRRVPEDVEFPQPNANWYLVPPVGSGIETLGSLYAASETEAEEKAAALLDHLAVKQAAIKAANDKFAAEAEKLFPKPEPAEDPDEA